MRVQVDIGFDQLVQLAKQLPATQWVKLKTEVEKKQMQADTISDMGAFLFNAPTFTKKQLDAIERTRKENASKLPFLAFLLQRQQLPIICL